MLPNVQQILSTNSAVTAIVGTSPCRVYLNTIAQCATMPAVVWSVVDGMTENYNDSISDIDNFRVQIDCWANTAKDADTLANAARAALEPSGHLVSFNGTDFEQDTKRHRVSFDFSIWTNR